VKSRQATTENALVPRHPIQSSGSLSTSHLPNVTVLLPQSADTVNKILDHFRAGRQNMAEFWINLQAKIVHIRYFASPLL
jgi:hypothetical protein